MFRWLSRSVAQADPAVQRPWVWAGGRGREAEAAGKDGKIRIQSGLADAWVQAPGRIVRWTAPLVYTAAPPGLVNCGPSTGQAIVVRPQTSWALIHARASMHAQTVSASEARAAPAAWELAVPQRRRQEDGSWVRRDAVEKADREACCLA